MTSPSPFFTCYRMESRGYEGHKLRVFEDIRPIQGPRSEARLI